MLAITADLAVLAELAVAEARTALPTSLDAAESAACSGTWACWSSGPSG